MQPDIRRAEMADRAALTSFAESCFREAFGSHFVPGTMDRLCAAVFAEPVMAELIAGGTWVAICGQEWQGYIAMGSIPSPIPDLIKPTSEIARLYVARRWQGTGISDQLMARFLAEVEACGGRSIWLQAYEGNPRALAFYRRWGFTDFGPFTLVCEGVVLPHRALGRNR